MNSSTPFSEELLTWRGNSPNPGFEMGAASSVAVPAADALTRSLQEEDAHRLDLARRLHKDVAGNLVACTAVCEMIRHQLGQDGTGREGVRPMLANIESALRQTLQVVRRLTEEQFPPVLTAFGLNAALQQFVKQVGSGFSGSLILHVNEEELALEPERRLNLFRILQMVIRRCVCDARSTWVEVTCRAVNGDLECTVDHDGEVELWDGGLENQELAIIKARCALLGCTFTSAAASPGSVPRTVLHVPLNASRSVL